MRAASDESRKVVCHVCVMWALVSGAWAVLHITTPFILKDIVGEERAPIWQGIFTSTTAFCGMFSCGIAGYLSDRVGRLKFLVPWVGVFFVTVNFVIYSDVYKTIYPMWFARAAALSIPSTVLHAFLSDFLAGDSLLESFGFTGAAFGSSLMVSSFICGYLKWRLSRLTSLFFSSFLAGMAFLVSLRLKVPSDVRPLPSVPAKTSLAPVFDSGIKSSLRIINKDVLLRNLILGFSIFRAGNVNVQMMLVLFANYRLGWGIAETSVLLGVTACLSVLIQLIGIKLIIINNAVLPVLFVCIFIMPLVSIGYCFVMSGYQLCFVAFLGSIATIAATIFNMKISGLATENNVSGLALGTVGVLQNLIEIVAAFLFGKLQSWSFTHYSSKEFLSGLPFVINGVFMGIVFFVVIYSHNKYGSCRTSWTEKTVKN